MRLTELETRVSAALHTPIHIAVCRSDHHAATLNPAEQAQLARFETDARRRDWRRGRLALKALLRSMGQSDDTSGIDFPCPRLSLTHGDGSALAVGTSLPEMRIGVDYEALRSVNERIARWFLNDSELEWLAQFDAAERADALIRLWTVKEAVFKCHPENKGLVLKDFTIADPSSIVCDVRSSDGWVFRCVSVSEDRGYISIAIQGEGNED